MENRSTPFSRFKDAWNTFWGEQKVVAGPKYSSCSATPPTCGASSANQVKQHGWRQCRILGKELVDKLTESGLLPDIDEDGHWVVLSHDCDVTNGSFVIEPCVEVIFGEHLEQEDGNKLWGKNSRLLQIVEAGRVYEFNAHRRATFCRIHLADNNPDSTSLSDECRQQLVGWIARRYVRRAFADEFNNRSRSAVKALRKNLKQDGELVSGIYLLVSDEELPEGTDYEVLVWVTMPEDDFLNETKRNLVVKLLGMIEAQLDGCDGITVESSELRSESHVSIADIRVMKRWDFDDLTLRDEGPDGLPRE